MRRKKSSQPMDWNDAADIKADIALLVKVLELDYIDPSRIITFRSYGSVARARARIWALPRVWQLALNIEPHYVIEVLSEKFDGLSVYEKRRTLIHELMHIPKNFSGALVPHRGRFHTIDDKVEQMLRLHSQLTK